MPAFLWTQKEDIGPSPRHGHAMCFDAARQRTFLFGGADEAPLGDSWTWSGQNWTQVGDTGPAPRFDHGTSDGYQFFLDLGPLGNADERHFHGEIAFWKEIVAHPNYDEFWQARSILPHLDGITAAVMVVGGWYDTEDLYGPLQTYAAIERQNPGIANRLVMGPWRHGGWARDDGEKLGGATFGFPTAAWYREAGWL